MCQQEQDVELTFAKLVRPHEDVSAASRCCDDGFHRRVAEKIDEVLEISVTLSTLRLQVKRGASPRVCAVRAATLSTLRLQVK